MRTEIEHFYWVAQAYGGAPGESAYHIQVWDIAESMDDVAELGGQAKRPRTLNMTAAKAEGLDVSALKAFIDSDALLHVDAALAHARTVEPALELAREEIEALRSEKAVTEAEKG